MLEALRYRAATASVEHVAPDALPRSADEVGEDRLWVDLCAPTAAEFARVFDALVPVHALTREDLTEVTPDRGAHLPKIEEFPDYLLVIVNPLPGFCARPGEAGLPDGPDRPQLGAVLTERVLVTVHAAEMGCVKQVQKYLDRHHESSRRGPDYVFHLVLDAMVDEYGPVVEGAVEELDRLERALFERPEPQLLNRILHVKRQVSVMRKTLILEREVLLRLTRGEFRLVDEREKAYYRNVYDHLVRYAELAETAREMAGDLVQTHLAASSNRLNEVMKVLTMISTVGLVCTLIAGVYGMNFEHMPELKWRYGYPFALSLMGLAAAGSFVFFRWKKWV